MKWIQFIQRRATPGCQSEQSHIRAVAGGHGLHGDGLEIEFSQDADQ